MAMICAVVKMAPAAYTSREHDARLGGALSFGMNLITVAGLEQTLAVGQPVKAALRFD